MDFTAGLTFARDQTAPDESRRTLARQTEAGLRRRVSRGAYAEADEWDALSEAERYRLKVLSVARTRRTRAVISHQSAAAVWAIPLLRKPPDHVHFTIPPTGGGRSKNLVIKHPAPLSDEDIVEFDGLAVTSRVRTVLDLATSIDFAGAVVAADHLLHVDRRGRDHPAVDRDQLEAAFDRMGSIRAFARVSAVLDFADSRADSPLESVSRVAMRKIGVPRPQLQVAHHDRRGFIGETDFAWPEFGVVGEADGYQKYLDDRFRAGRSADQVVVDEKRREDRLRALPRTVVRWDWSVAMSPRALGDRLAAAGLPTGTTW